MLRTQERYSLLRSLSAGSVPSVDGEHTNNREALRRLGIGFGLAAAVLVVLATFLPRLHCPTIELQHNRLIDRSEGSWFLALAAIVVLGSLGGIADRRGGWLLLFAGLVILGLTIYSSTGSRSLVLGDVPGVEEAVHGDLGFGLGLSGLSGLLAAGGGLLVASTT